MAYSAETYRKALEFASQAHGDQRTPTGLPYMVHLALVAAELTAALREEPGLDEDLAIQCALLHDVLEDTKVTPGELERAFGERVAAGVRALTKDPVLPKTEQMEDVLRRIAGQPREIAVVKLSDRIANLSPPPPSWTNYKVAEYRKEAQRIFDALQAASPFLARRFEEKLATYGAERQALAKDAAAKEKEKEKEKA